MLKSYFEIMTNIKIPQKPPTQPKEIKTIFDAIDTHDLKEINNFVQANGADTVVATLNEHGFSVMHWATLTDDVQVVKYFLDLKANCNDYTSNRTAQAPIHWACKKGNIDIVNIFLTQGVDVNQPDGKGYTPLITAAQYGHIPLVTFLIGRGARINLEDHNGDNALHWAAYKGHAELSSLLIYYGLNAKRVDNFGQTPLHLACANGNISTVKQLSEFVDLRLKDNNGKTPLELAKARNFFDAVEYFERIQESGVFRFCDWKTLCFGPVGNSKWIFILCHIILLCIQYPIYFIVAVPRTFHEHYIFHIFYIIVNILLWITLYVAHYVNPGYLKKNSAEYHAAIRRMTYQSQNQSVKELKKSHARLCHTCKLVRPYRTSHCRSCNRCVLAFDHHCPYIQNCVGYYNRVWFFCFVTCVTTCASFNIRFCYLILYDEPYHYATCFGLLLSVLYFLMSFSLTAAAVFNALINITINEGMKYKKYEYLMDANGNYKNIFNKGFVYNLKYFFHLVEPSDLEKSTMEYNSNPTV